MCSSQQQKLKSVVFLPKCNELHVFTSLAPEIICPDKRHNRAIILRYGIHSKHICIEQII